jgi:hypothetical protein
LGLEELPPSLPSPPALSNGKIHSRKFGQNRDRVNFHIHIYQIDRSPSSFLFSEFSRSLFSSLPCLLQTHTHLIYKIPVLSFIEQILRPVANSHYCPWPPRMHHFGLDHSRGRFPYHYFCKERPIVNPFPPS